MRLVQRTTPIISLLVLALVLPAAYGAGPGKGGGKDGGQGGADADQTAELTGPVELAANQVRISQLRQSDDGGATWTGGANVSHAEGDDVPFRLDMNPSAAGIYTIELEYTHTLTKGDVTAYGYLGVSGFDILEGPATVLSHAPGPVGTQADQTTKSHSVTLHFTEPGPVALTWIGTLAMTGVGYDPLGPASISGARVHMQLLSDGSKDAPIQTNSITLNPDVDPEPCSGVYCDPIGGCTENCDVDPPCTENCDVDPPCTENCDVDPPCTENCEVDPPCTENCEVDPPLDPVCQGTLQIRTVDGDGKRVGPSKTLVRGDPVELTDGETELTATACGTAIVSLTQVPTGYSVSTTTTSVAGAGLEAANLHLAQTTVEIEDDVTTEVVFVLVATGTGPSDPVDPVDPVDVIDDGEDRDPTEPAKDGDDEDDVTTPAKGNGPQPAPVPSGGDDLGAPRGSSDTTDGDEAPVAVPTTDTLPRTGVDTPLLLLVATALLAMGVAALRTTRREVRTGR